MSAAERMRRYRRRKKVAGHHLARNTGEQEWYTPAAYIEAARDVLGAIDLDPASSEEAQKTVQAARYFTAADNGLAHDWHGRVWLNPPYAYPAIERFCTKLVAELAAGRVTAAVLLTNNSSDTAWFHAAAEAAALMCHTRGRIKFIGPRPPAALQGQAFFYFGPDKDRFAERFALVGILAKTEANGRRAP